MAKAEPYGELLRQQPGLAQQSKAGSSSFLAPFTANWGILKEKVVSGEPVWAARVENSQWGNPSKEVCTDASAASLQREEGQADSREGKGKSHLSQRK